MANNITLSYPSAFHHQFFDRNGKPLTSGKLYTYIAGSTTPVVTYKTISGGTESANRNTNPIILDMNGMAELVIAKDTAYKFILFDRNNVKINEWDNVTAGGSEGGGSSTTIIVEGTEDEIKVEEEDSEGVVKRFIVSLAKSIKDFISSITSSVNEIIEMIPSNASSSNKLATSKDVSASICRVIAVDYDNLTFPIAKDTLCFHDGGYFYANTDISISEPWTAANWTETNVSKLCEQYITSKELVNLASNWEDVTSKVFNNNGVDATSSNFKFFFNRSLALFKITGWAQFSGNNTSKRKCISFNTDLPGNQDTNLFSFTIVSKVSNSGYTNSGVCTTILRPFAHSSFHDYDNGIYIDRPSISCNYVDSIFVIANIDNLLEEFCQYIDSH